MLQLPPSISFFCLCKVSCNGYTCPSKKLLKTSASNIACPTGQCSENICCDSNDSILLSVLCMRCFLLLFGRCCVEKYVWQRICACFLWLGPLFQKQKRIWPSSVSGPVFLHKRLPKLKSWFWPNALNATAKTDFFSCNVFLCNSFKQWYIYCFFYWTSLSESKQACNQHQANCAGLGGTCHSSIRWWGRWCCLRHIQHSTSAACFKFKSQLFDKLAHTTATLIP